MSKRMAWFAAGVTLVVLVAVLWARRGGLAQGFQEEDARRWALLVAGPAAVDSTECWGCHPAAHEALAQTGHRSVECWSCHEGSVDHLQGQGTPFVDRSPELCGSCHSQVIGRRADFPQVDLRRHSGGSPCTTCHEPHGPALAGSGRCQVCHRQAYQQWTSGKHSALDCRDCHGPAAGHLQGQGTPFVDGSPQLCRSCHSPGDEAQHGLPQIDPGTHAGRLPCGMCHRPH